jgi:hypothetical protein
VLEKLFRPNIKKLARKKNILPLYALLYHPDPEIRKELIEALGTFTGYKIFLITDWYVIERRVNNGREPFPETQGELITLAAQKAETSKESEDYARYSEKLLNDNINYNKGISTHHRYSPVVQNAFIQALVDDNLIKIRSKFRNRSAYSDPVRIALSGADDECLIETVCETLPKFEHGAIVNFIHTFKAPQKYYLLLYETIGKTLSDNIKLVRTYKYHYLDNTSTKLPEEIRVNLERYLNQAEVFSQMLELEKLIELSLFFPLDSKVASKIINYGDKSISPMLGKLDFIERNPIEMKFDQESNRIKKLVLLLVELKDYRSKPILLRFLLDEYDSAGTQSMAEELLIKHFNITTTEIHAIKNIGIIIEKVNRNEEVHGEVQVLRSLGFDSISCIKQIIDQYPLNSYMRTDRIRRESRVMTTNLLMTLSGIVSTLSS